VIDKLKLAGAEGILVVPIDKIVLWWIDIITQKKKAGLKSV
jgi:hypothetical protein